MLPTIMDTDVNRQAIPDVDHTSWVDPAQLAEIMIDLTRPSKTNLSGALIPVQGKML